MKAEQQIKPLILVYFRLRGKMQPIRNIVSYLGLPSFEVHIDDQTQKHKIPEDIKNFLKGLKIDRTSLPLLIYQTHQVYETIPILNFICRRFNAEGLMGRDIKQRARVNELMDVWMAKEATVMGDIFRLAENSVTKGQQEINRSKIVLYQRWINDSGYIAEVCQFLTVNNGIASFVFGQITLIDFLFLETSHYVLGIFSSLFDQNNNLPEGLSKLLSNDKDLREMKHFKLMGAYVYKMEALSFYCDNRVYLQSFSMALQSIPPERKTGLKKIWGYKPSLVK